MKLKNQTDWPDYFVRRMVSWCCKQLDVPVREVGSFRLVRSKYAYSGLCEGTHVTVRIGDDSKYPRSYRVRDTGVTHELRDRTEGLIVVTAHELAHVAQNISGTKRERRMRFGRGWAEYSADAQSIRVLTTFREQRDLLLASWSKEPAVALRPPKPTAVQVRAKRAADNLANWQRKLKLAQTKVKKYRRQVAYYERNSVAGA